MEKGIKTEEASIIAKREKIDNLNTEVRQLEDRLKVGRTVNRFRNTIKRNRSKARLLDQAEDAKYEFEEDECLYDTGHSYCRKLSDGEDKDGRPLCKRHYKQYVDTQRGIGKLE